MSIIGIEATGDPYIKWDGTAFVVLQYGIQSYPYDRPTMMRKWAEAKGCANPVTGRLNLTAVTEYTGCSWQYDTPIGRVSSRPPWNIGSTSSTEYIWEVLRPLDRSPVQSGTVALHRVVGSVGATKALPISAGSTLTIDTYAVDATVIGTLTAADPTGAGHLRAYPCSAGRPNARCSTTRRASRWGQEPLYIPTPTGGSACTPAQPRMCCGIRRRRMHCRRVLRGCSTRVRRRR